MAPRRLRNRNSIIPARQRLLRGRGAAQTQEESDIAFPELTGIESDQHDDEGESCELHVYENRIDTRGMNISLRKDPSHHAALVLTRHYTRDRKLQNTYLEIRSPYLLRALKEVVRSYPGVNIDSMSRITVRNEPKCLFHFQEELKTFAASSDDRTMKKHIRLCLQYMAKSLKREIMIYNTTVRNSPTDPSLEYENLWMAYKPGMLMYSTVDGVDDQRGEWSVDQTDFRYIKGRLVRVPFPRPISHYEGSKALRQLSTFPLDFHPEKARIRRELIMRGRKFISLLGMYHRYYDGVAELYGFSGLPPESAPRKQTRSLRGRIMVDFPTLQMDNLDIPPYSSRHPVIMVESGPQLALSDEELLICSPYLHGYSFEAKSWGWFLVDNIQDIDFKPEAFSKLVLPQKQKEMLSSLVHLQEDLDTGFNDLIEDKGKGLIVLLHGPPGVGKTFTAESIADHTKRPLLRLDSGQLIGPAVLFERQLADILVLATRWKALVLLDEADVFIQQRTTSELQRNGLVSSLLSAVEYFEGVLFLTTNRFEAIDSAFKSRIHLSIAYQPLSLDGKKQLWQDFITRAYAKEHLPPWVTKRFLDKVAEAPVNGREIRNIVRMAHALARNKGRAIKAEDIFQGIEAMETFETSVASGDSIKRPDVISTHEGCQENSLASHDNIWTDAGA
ncbi:P-loop containing nucleoside triphosphate hydrolase protein [Whalleya microplaca]|nr:P-loop containing nucleoside triphosphate hydrolase protein [Whalleya microplaca]